MLKITFDMQGTQTSVKDSTFAGHCEAAACHAVHLSCGPVVYLRMQQQRRRQSLHYCQSSSSLCLQHQLSFRLPWPLMPKGVCTSYLGLYTTALRAKRTYTAR